MMQIIDGKKVYVVDFDTMPELPITGLTEYEQKYEDLLSTVKGFIHKSFHPYYSSRGMYAEALTSAIATGIVTEPGKYGIHIDIETNRWEVFKIIEK